MQIGLRTLRALGWGEPPTNKIFIYKPTPRSNFCLLAPAQFSKHSPPQIKFYMANPPRGATIVCWPPPNSLPFRGFHFRVIGCVGPAAGRRTYTHTHIHTYTLSSLYRRFHDIQWRLFIASRLILSFDEHYQFCKRCLANNKQPPIHYPGENVIFCLFDHIYSLQYNINLAAVLHNYLHHNSVSKILDLLLPG